MMALRGKPLAQLVVPLLLLQKAALGQVSGVLDGPEDGLYYTSTYCPGPGTDGDDDCKCAFTRSNDAGWDGSCAAGYYCPYGNSTAVSCNFGDDASNPTQGLYCPENTQTPRYCCKGYYCPSTTEIYACPSGDYCKVGSVEPVSCPWLTTCSEKTSNPLNAVPLVLLILLVVVAWILHSQISKCRAAELLEHSVKLEREEKIMKQGSMTRKQFTEAGGTSQEFDDLDANSDGIVSNSELRASHEAALSAEVGHKSDHGTSNTKKAHKQTFDFKFDGLGLTLNNGITIMKGVTGSIRHGRVTAVMGPSGAGKTTFLNLLSGKAEKTHGDIYIKSTVDGDYQLENDGIYRFRKLCGFVPQEDTMHRRLRVYDNIYFSGSFRLPNEYTSEMVAMRTDEVINTLGLGSVQHSPIGDETLRGISGGQRKRVNIGMEVVADPRVLFLDEPTSGLDSTSSQEVLIALKQFATEEDMTIVTVIHQPRLEIYKLIDDLLLLGKGGITVYLGPREEAETYFGGLGFNCVDVGVNPIDFFMDIISGDVPRAGHKDFVKEDLFRLWKEHAAAMADVAGVVPEMNPISKGKDDIDNPFAMDIEANSSQPGGGTGSSTSIISELSTSSLSYGAGTGANEADKEVQAEVQVEVQQVSEPEIAKKNCCAQCCCNCLTDFRLWWYDLGLFFYQCLIESPCKPGFRKTPSLCYVFLLVMRRSFAQQFRDFTGFMNQNILHLVLGMFLSALTSQGVTFVGPIPAGVVSTCPYTLQGACTNPLQDDYLGIAGFLCWSIGFAGIAVGSITFGSEKPQFWREQGSGMNFIVYFYAKLAADIPKIMFAAACFTFALLAGFATNSSAIKVYGVVLMMYYAGFSLGYLVSAFVSQDMSALLGVAISMLFAIQLSGTSSPKLKDVNDGSNPLTKTLFFLSYARWGTEAFYINEMDHFKYENIGPYIDEQGFTLGSDQYGTDLLNIFLSSLIWQFIAMVFLKMNNRQAQK